MRVGFARLLRTLIWFGILAARCPAQSPTPPRPPTPAAPGPSQPARVFRVIDGDRPARPRALRQVEDLIVYEPIFPDDPFTR
jgi:hypothetical protein